MADTLKVRRSAFRITDWVAMIDRLGPNDLEALKVHFLSLDAEDRRLRFGISVGDHHIIQYVDRIIRRGSYIYGVRNGSGGWLGIGHLVAEGSDAELGLSVLPGGRGKGLGAAIFRFAVAQASRDGAKRPYMHCLTSNRAILAIARAAGMSIGSSGGESDAWLTVPPHADLIRLLIGEPAAA